MNTARNRSRERNGQFAREFRAVAPKFLPKWARRRLSSHNHFDGDDPRYQQLPLPWDVEQKKAVLASVAVAVEALPAIPAHPAPTPVAQTQTPTKEPVAAEAAAPVKETKAAAERKPSQRQIRINRANAAQKKFDALDRVRLDAVAAANGRAVPPDYCGACRHKFHNEQCRQACECAEYVQPSTAEIAAHSAIMAAHEAEQELFTLREAAGTWQKGDRYVVTKGRAVPIGLTGRLLRTHSGPYGQRMLILFDGETSARWVTAGNLRPEQSE